MSALAEEIKKLLEEHHIIKKAESRLSELIPEITRLKNARKYSLVKLDTLMATQNHNRVITNPFMKSFRIGRHTRWIYVQRNIL